MQNKRILLKKIREKWDCPEKLLDYILELDKQSQIDIELAYKKGLKETAKNYSILYAYSLRKGGAGKKTLPLYLDNINIVSKQLEEGKLTIEDMQQELIKFGINIIYEDQMSRQLVYILKNTDEEIKKIQDKMLNKVLKEK